MASAERLADPRAAGAHPVGEIDRRGRVLAFVKVKAPASELEAGMALDEYRLRRVARANEALAPRYSKPGGDIGIDALFIIPGPPAAPPRQRLARVTAEACSPKRSP